MEVLRQMYILIDDEKGWKMRYNTEIYDLYDDMKVTTFIKFRQLQWAGYIINMVEHHGPKEVLQKIFHSKRSVGKLREKWEDGVLMMASCYLAHRLQKTKPKI